MENIQPYLVHDTPRMTRSVRVLVAMNIAVAFLQWTVISRADAFAVLGFQDASLERTLWSAITYLFVHYGVAHLALTTYALLAFGPRLEATMGTRAFALFYLWCGLGGAMAHLLFLRGGLLIGASSAVFGVMYAYSQQWPNDEVALFGAIPMRAWTLVVLLIAGIVGVSAYGAADPVAGGQPLAALAHLGGLAAGWLYFRTPPAASLDRLRQRISPAPDFHDEAPPRAIPRTGPRTTRPQRDDVDEIVAKSRAVAAEQPRPATRATLVQQPKTATRAEELNRVLDKISSSGLESLSSDERAVLDAMARRLRGEP